MEKKAESLQSYFYSVKSKRKEGYMAKFINAYFYPSAGQKFIFGNSGKNAPEVKLRHFYSQEVPILLDGRVA